MTKRPCLKALAPLLAFVFLAEGQAMSRHHDGEAQVWVREGSLCIGASATYAVSGFFSSKARLDQNQVTLYAVQVNRPAYPAWSTEAPRDTTASSTRLQPGACIEYGKPIASFSTSVPPRELQPDVYEVLLQASDQDNRRAWFYKRFCLSNEAGSWAVTDAVRLDGASQWRCARSPDS